VVDDNPLIATVLRSLLQAHGLEVHVATNGEEAVQSLLSHDIEVIVCDVMMPRMDGYEFHEHVRQRSEFAHIPFIFLTALSDDTEKHRGLLAGADVYLTKPFDPAAMIPLVQGKVTRARGLRKAREQERASFRKKVVNTLSHEFRTPLVAITTGSELLLDHADKFDSNKVQQLVQAIQRGGSRLERLVNDFMLLQQLELGTGARIYESRGAVQEVDSVIARACELRFAELSSQGFQARFESGLGNIKCYLHAPQLEDMLFRLIDNAAKFSRDVKEITVSSGLVGEGSGRNVSITVRDRGVGIPEGHTLSLELFGQVDRERLEQQGTGMGLAIVQRYASIMGGSLSLSPRQEGGAEAVICFPIRGAAPDKTAL
jgi:signal transduction histidine kinase